MNPKKPTSSSSQSWVDRVLIVVIVGGLATVGYSFYKKRIANPVPVTSVAPAIETSKKPNVVGSQLDEQNFLAALSPISDGEWDEFKATSVVRSVIEKKTTSCSEPSRPDEKALTYFDRTQAASILKGEQRLLFNWYGRCFLAGENLYVLTVGSADDQPVVKLEGFVVVTEILTSRNSLFPSELLKRMGTDREAVAKMAEKMGHPANDEIAILRLSKMRPVISKLGAPIPSLFPFKVLDKKQMELLGLQAAPLHIVDVRDTETATKYPIPNAQHVPFTLPGFNSGKFNWEMKVGELKQAQFDVNAILASAQQNPGRTVIIVGWSPTDARPLWALLRLHQSGFRNAIWFYPGATMLKKALKL